MEEEVAKSLLQLEINNGALKENLSQVVINSADLVEYKQADGTASKTLFVRIPFRSLPGFRKVADKIVAHLESKFNWPVIVIANRTIISKHGKFNQTIDLSFCDFLMIFLKRLNHNFILFV